MVGVPKISRAEQLGMASRAVRLSISYCSIARNEGWQSTVATADLEIMLHHRALVQAFLALLALEAELVVYLASSAPRACCVKADFW